MQVIDGVKLKHVYSSITLNILLTNILFLLINIKTLESAVCPSNDNIALKFIETFGV